MKRIELGRQGCPGRGSLRQDGLVQGVVLFFIAVLVAIVAAFSFANNGNQSSSERESAKVAATVLMKQAGEVDDAVKRYLSDGLSLIHLCVTSGVPAVTVNANASDCVADTGGTPVHLFDKANGYVNPPDAPAAAFRASKSSGTRYWQYSNFSLAGRSLISEEAPGVYAFMQAEDVDQKVCQAINRMLNKEQNAPLVPEEQEVCYLQAGVYVYRKVIANRKSAGA